MRAFLMRLVPAACVLALWAGAGLAQNSSPGSVTTTGAAAPAKPAAAGVRLSRSQEFATVAAATAACPGDTVVWSTLNKKSRNFHVSGSRYYGKTKHGAYLCEKAALAAGFHQSKG